MITVRRSDTGSFVLVHEPSQTVMVGEDLDATFARMQERLRDDPSLPRTVAAPAAPRPRYAWLVGLGVLALMPFLWLGVLHYTLGRMIDELRAAPEPPAPSEQVEQLRSELEELRQVVSRVEDEVGHGRRGLPSDTPRPARARRIGERVQAVLDPDAVSPEAPEVPESATATRQAAVERRRRKLEEAEAEAKAELDEPDEPGEPDEP